jgi:two-component system chemotaxis family response regulator WspR
LRQWQQHALATNLELQRLTHSDGLTGLLNRRHLDQYLSAECVAARANNPVLVS